MSLARLQEVLAARRHSACPFLVLGDPTPEVSFELAVAAIDLGAPMLELGLPFSDPCADGPAIQEAVQRAFAGGTGVAGAFALMERIAAARPGVPFNLLVYGNLVHARGYERFCRDAVAAGAGSVLVPDIPLEEGAPLAAACAGAGLGLVSMVAPRTPEERLRRLDVAATAFLYLAAHQGVTGAVGDDAGTRRDLVARVAAAAERPVCVGFGLRTAGDVTAVFDAGARIAVVGSHLARAVAGAWRDGSGAPQEVVSAFTTAFRPLAVPQDSQPGGPPDARHHAQ